MKSYIKSASEIEAMRHGAKILAQSLINARAKAAAGMRTKELADSIALDLKGFGVRPAFLGYNGFPDVACISVNNEVVHGIPGSRVIKQGDIVSIDLGVVYKGLITDSATTVYIGSNEPEDIKTLMRSTEKALYDGIAAINGETPVGTVAAAIQKELDSHKLGIVRDLVGHGVGHGMHEDPNIPNYGIKGAGFRLQPGMTVAIEPMATLGGWQVNINKDGWTVVTRDGSLAAHFEHTVLITEGPAEILTKA